MDYTNPLTSIADFLSLGGPVVALLLALSIVALAVVLFKVYQFLRYRVGQADRARKSVLLWRQGYFDEAYQNAVGGKSASAISVARAIELLLARKSQSGKTGFDGLTKEAIEEAVTLTATQELHGLRSGFRLLDTIAQIAPLLGLFGTVLGMIEAFQKLQGAGNSVDPSILAGGIWVALLTTAVGLAVAMPTSVALTWLETRLENERLAVEGLAHGILAPAGVQEASSNPLTAHQAAQIVTALNQAHAL